MIRYAITDRLGLPGNAAAQERALLRQAERLAADRVEYLQVRERDLPFAEAVALAVRLQSVFAATGAAAGAPTRVLLNTAWPPDHSAWPEGLGLHLSSASLGLLRRDEALGLPRPLSMSCHSVAEAQAAAAFADLLLFAPVFEKEVRGEHVGEGRGLAMLASVCHAVAPLPVLALGGVTPANAAACMDAGAAGVAGIRLFR